MPIGNEKSLVHRALDQMSGQGKDEPRDEARQQRRLEIVAAATELFVQQGYRKTSMEEIALRCGLAKGTLYLYCDSKADLLVQALSEEKRRHAGTMAFLDDPELTPREKLRRFLGVVLAMSDDLPLLTRLLSGDRELFSALSEMPTRLHAERRKGLIDILGSILRDGIEAHDWSPEGLDERAAVVGGLTYFASLLSEEHVRFGLSRERFAQVLSHAIVEGIGKPCD